MWPSNRGAISFLCVSVVLPLLLVVIAVGVELQQFYGIREYVQQVVDNRARFGLARHQAPDEVEREIRGELAPLSPQVGAVRLSSAVGPSRGEILLRAEYRGAFWALSGYLTEAQLGMIPFAVSSEVRRLRTTALIVLDRTFSDGGDGCTDSALRERGSLVDELSAALRAHGVTTVSVGVFPGVDAPFSILPSDSEGSRLIDCEGTSSLSFHMGSVRGALAEGWDPLEIGQEIAEKFVAGLGADTESFSIIFVGRRSDQFERAVTFAHSFVRESGAPRRLSMSNVVLAQVLEGTVRRDSPIFGVSYLQFVVGIDPQPELVTSVSAHVSGPVMVAR